MAKHRSVGREYNRPRGQREPRQTVFIACEGAKTEPNYFKAFKNELGAVNVTVRIVPGDDCGTDPVSVVAAAKEARDDGWDHSWAVFDTERHGTRPNLPTPPKGVHRAVSNPCFEVWYILHYTDSTRQYEDGDRCVNALKQHIPDYQKSMNVHAILGSKTDSALQNASKLRQHHEALGLVGPHCNPYTEVDLLVQQLLELGGK